MEYSMIQRIKNEITNKSKATKQEASISCLASSGKVFWCMCEPPELQQEYIVIMGRKKDLRSWNGSYSYDA